MNNYNVRSDFDIRKAFKELNVTIGELSERLDVSRATFHKSLRQLENQEEVVNVRCNMLFNVMRNHQDVSERVLYKTVNMIHKYCVGIDLIKRNVTSNDLSFDKLKLYSNSVKMTSILNVDSEQINEEEKGLMDATLKAIGQKYDRYWHITSRDRPRKETGKVFMIHVNELTEMINSLDKFKKNS